MKSSNSSKHPKTLLPQFRWNSLNLGLLVILLVLTGYLIVKFIHASSTTLYLMPASASVTQDSTIAIAVRLDTGGESVNGVQANLVYPADKFDFVSINDAGSAFGIVATSQGGNGSVSIARGSSGGAGVTGDVLVTTVNFRAKAAAGSAAVNFASSGSAVTRSNGDGVNILSGTTGGNYTLQAAPVSTPAPAPGSVGSTPAPNHPPAPTPTKAPITTPGSVGSTPAPITQVTASTPTPSPSPVNVQTPDGFHPNPLGNSAKPTPLANHTSPSKFLGTHAKPFIISGVILILLAAGVIGVMLMQRSGSLHLAAISKKTVNMNEPPASPTFYPSDSQPPVQTTSSPPAAAPLPAVPPNPPASLPENTVEHSD